AHRRGPPELARGAGLGGNTGRCRWRNWHTAFGRPLELLANPRTGHRRARLYRRLDLPAGSAAVVLLQPYAGACLPYLDSGRRRALPTGGGRRASGGESDKVLWSARHALSRHGVAGVP